MTVRLPVGRRRPQFVPDERFGPDGDAPAAVDEKQLAALKERFVSGELGPDEYERRLDALLHPKPEKGLASVGAGGRVRLRRAAPPLSAASAPRTARETQVKLRGWIAGVTLLALALVAVFSWRTVGPGQRPGGPAFTESLPSTFVFSGAEWARMGSGSDTDGDTTWAPRADGFLLRVAQPSWLYRKTLGTATGDFAVQATVLLTEGNGTVGLTVANNSAGYLGARVTAETRRYALVQRNNDTETTRTLRSGRLPAALVPGSPITLAVQGTGNRVRFAVNGTVLDEISYDDLTPDEVGLQVGTTTTSGPVAAVWQRVELLGAVTPRTGSS